MPPARTSLHQILGHQRLWARNRGLELALPDHTRDWRDNLLLPLSDAAKTALATHPHQPLGESGKPADLSRLHSSLALVCNSLDPWSVQEAQTLADCVGAAAGASEVALAPVLEEGVEEGGDPVVAHALFTGKTARPTVLVASFAEPYDQPETRAVATESRDPEPLPGCALLEADQRAQPRRFASLGVAQLLACARASTRRHGERGFRLVYVWYDAADTIARQHRAEIDRFRMRVGGEVEFHSATWQQVIGQMRERVVAHRGVVLALTERYLRR